MSKGNDPKDTYSCFGMGLFLLSFVATLAFFGYTMMVNPGPLDTGVEMVIARFTKSDADTRMKDWVKSTPENVTYGQELYKTNCALCHSEGAKDALLEKAASGGFKSGMKPLEVYKFLRKGMANGEHRFDYIPEREKFALITFLRSKSSNAPDNSSGEWSNFLKQGIY